MNLPRPSFVRLNPELDTAEMVSQWEALTGNPLFPAQLERLLINLLSYRENLVRRAIQYGCEQSIVNYATGDRLDQLGAFSNTNRLGQAPATTTLRFTLDSAIATTAGIPQGTRVTAGGGTPNFATDRLLVIPAGQTEGTVTATAQTPGVGGNDLAIGAISTLVDPLPGLAISAQNTTLSSGGADVESDDRYRARVILSSSQFSVAGSVNSYEFWARSASQTIRSVSVISPAPIYVEVYILTDSGLPDSELIASVQEILRADDIRPLTDIVTVLAPTQVNYTIEVEITLYDWADQLVLQDQLNAAIALYCSSVSSELGNDVVHSQIVAALSLDGVYSVDVLAPVADIVVEPNEWAVCSGSTVTIVGEVEG